MRGHPIGTGPFKFGDFKPNEYIKVMRNPDYWKKGRPYLDGIEYTVTRNRSTTILAFIAGKYDLTFAGSVTVPLMKEVNSQMPEAICELPPGSVSNNLIVNRDAPPFDNPDLRRAMALSLDRQAFVDILSEGKGNVGGGPCSRRPEGCGACRRMSCRRCRAMTPTCRKTAQMPARSCKSSATDPITGSR